MRRRRKAKNSLLDIDVIRSAIMAGGYQSITKHDKINNCDITVHKLMPGDFVSRFQSYGVTVGTDGMTCYFGSVRSDTYIRIYDKQAEQEADLIRHWVRCEIQLRRENALGFILLDGNLSDNFFGVLNNYIRFIEPNSNDSNKRRAATATWWEKFLQSSDRLRIFRAPQPDYDRRRLDRFVFTQCSGAVYTMIRLIGIRKFCKRLLQSVVYGDKLNFKYLELLNNNSISCDCSNLDDFVVPDIKQMAQQSHLKAMAKCRCPELS